MPANKRLTTPGSDHDKFSAPKARPMTGLFRAGAFRRDIRANLKQLITLSGWDITDSFKLQFAGQKTIAFVDGTNGTAAAIQAELRTLTGDAALTVTGTTDAGPFTVTFSGARLTNGRPWKLLAVVDGTGGTTGVVTAVARDENLLGTSRISSAADGSVALVPPTLGASTPTNAVAEVQTITKGTATGGTFTVRFRGAVTAALAHNITAAALQTALRALVVPGVDMTAITVVTDANPAITFPKAVGDAELMVLDTTLLTGGTVHTIAQTTQGVLGSISQAYTEQATIGDSVIAACVEVATGKVFDEANDAATPVVFDGLKPGTYKVVLSTVADGRVSRQVESSDVTIS